MLFQQQDGVDVCLYCIYVQEYGDDCPAPNKCASPVLLPLCCASTQCVSTHGEGTSSVSVMQVV